MSVCQKDLNHLGSSSVERYSQFGQNQVFYFISSCCNILFHGELNCNIRKAALDSDIFRL